MLALRFQWWQSLASATAHPHFRTPDSRNPRAVHISSSAVSWNKETPGTARAIFFCFVEKALIPRYTRQEMGHVWSDANKFAKWLESSLPPRRPLPKQARSRKEAAAAIRSRRQGGCRPHYELEARVKHDVVAFTMAVGDSIEDPAALAGCITA